MSSKLIKPKTVKGFRDLLPIIAQQKSKMLDSTISVFRSYAYKPIETPHLELSEILLGETEGDIGKQLFRFEDQGGRDVTMRFDLTVPFARYVVQHKNEIGFPFKRYVIGNCFRGENPQRGRYREFTQCDFDIVGTENLSADAEIIQIVIKSLLSMGLSNFKVKVNNRKVLTGLAKVFNLEEQAEEFIRIVDKLDKIGFEKVVSLLSEKVGFDLSFESLLKSFLSNEGDRSQRLKNAKEILKDTEIGLVGIKELEEVFKILDNLKFCENYFDLDLSIARGLGYYTGTVYETHLLNALDLGSVSSGGRYDNLTQNYSKDLLPAVGGSLGIDRILAYFENEDLNLSPADILITFMDSSLAPKLHELANSLREEGVKVEIFPEVSKLKKQFTYAERNKYKYVLMQGEDEFLKEIFALKNIETGEKIEVKSIAELAEKVL